MDLVTRKVVRGGETVELTAREYGRLEYLLRHAGHPVPRDTLARDVWKETARGTPLNNVIDVHIAWRKPRLYPHQGQVDQSV